MRVCPTALPSAAGTVFSPSQWSIMAALRIAAAGHRESTWAVDTRRGRLWQDAWPHEFVSSPGSLEMGNAGSGPVFSCKESLKRVPYHREGDLAADCR